MHASDGYRTVTALNRALMITSQHDRSAHIQKRNMASSGVPRLQLINICKSYNSLKANDQIHLTVQPGQIHAILGENGAGKSTLMKIIYGATKANQGQILCPSL